VVLTGDEAHYFRQVLRVSAGDVVALFDGRGHEWTSQVLEVSKQQVTLTDLKSATPVCESPVPVTLAMGVLKGDQMDHVIRDATMLGVSVIAPMRTAHVTVPPKAWQSGAARDRWARVAVSSAAQSRRAVVPEIRPVVAFEALLREPFPCRLICVEPALIKTRDPWLASPPPESVQLLIGPEGGWSESEVEQAVTAGARMMGLGPRTLRAETAPVVALTMVASAWGW
jgi:16S rRNA (uracil1498-N3)-methyltransferase